MTSIELGSYGNDSESNESGQYHYHAMRLRRIEQIFRVASLAVPCVSELSDDDCHCCGRRCTGCAASLTHCRQNLKELLLTSWPIVSTTCYKLMQKASIYIQMQIILQILVLLNMYMYRTCVCTCTATSYMYMYVEQRWMSCYMNLCTALPYFRWSSKWVSFCCHPWLWYSVVILVTPSNLTERRLPSVWAR